MLFVATSVSALCGCGGKGERFENVEDARTNARDALQALGAKITQKRLPLLGLTYAVDLSGAVESWNTQLERLTPKRDSALGEVALHASGVRRLNHLAVTAALPRVVHVLVAGQANIGAN